MTGGGSGREGGRALKTRVKTARKRSLSSTLWLERQLNDPYVSQARREGYRSRSAYKLLEIADKHKLFKPGQRIVDLGAAPGGWSQVAAAQTRAKDGAGRVIAIDLIEMDPVEGVEFRRMDFHDPDAPRHLREWLVRDERTPLVIEIAPLQLLDEVAALVGPLLERLDHDAIDRTHPLGEWARGHRVQHSLHLGEQCHPCHSYWNQPSISMIALTLPALLYR